MKIVFHLVLLVVLCSGHDVLAQRTNIGLKGGFHASEFDLKLDELISNYHFGVYSYCNLNRRFTIQGEVNYLSKKTTRSEEQLVIKELQFPVLLKYKIYNPFYIQSGFQYNVIPSAETNGVGVEDDSIPNYFSAFLGLGIGLPSGFEFSTRYYFLDFVEGSSADPLAASAVQVSIGFDIY